MNMILKTKSKEHWTTKGQKQ